MRKKLATLVPFLVLLASSVASSAVTKLVVDVPTRPGVSERILLVAPDAPAAHVIVLNGNEGVIGIRDDGSTSTIDISHFIDLYVADGISFTTVDPPSDRTMLDADFRRSADHATDLLTIIGYLQQRAPVPVWIIGLGTANISAASVASKLPPDFPLGLVFGNPHTAGVAFLTPSELSSIYRPTLVINHSQDACPCCPPSNVPFMVAQLVNAPATGHIELVGGDGDGGDPCSDLVGPHAWGGVGDVAQKAISGWISDHNDLLGNSQGLWWAAGGTEPFWGINFAHSANQVFATWYTYDTAGKPWWLSMLANRTTPTGNAYSGPIYVDVGSPFNNFTGSATPTEIGNGTVTFTDAKHGTFHYDLNAGTGGAPGPVSQNKVLERYNLGAGRQPICMFSATTDLALATNYQDLWWAASGMESGWGINFAHQGDTIFATWYTYDVDGTPLWLSALTQRQGTTNVYKGDLLRTSGPRFDNYKASDVVQPIPTVGTVTLTFTSANSASFNYTTDGNGGLPAGVNQTKSIVRFPFGPGGTLCQ
jgi:hypothetical protein